MSSKPIIIVGIRFNRCGKYIYRSGSRVLVTDDSMHTHGSVTMIPFSHRWPITSFKSVPNSFPGGCKWILAGKVSRPLWIVLYICRRQLWRLRHWVGACAWHVRRRCQWRQKRYRDYSECSVWKSGSAGIDQPDVQIQTTYFPLSSSIHKWTSFEKSGN